MIDHNSWEEAYRYTYKKNSIKRIKVFGSIYNTYWDKDVNKFFRVISRDRAPRPRIRPLGE